MADYENISEETLGLAEGFANAPSQAFDEAVDFSAFYPATPYHIGGDFGVYNVAMASADVEEFMRSRSPLGYGLFRDFVAGEYKFRRAYVDFVFRPIDGADAQLTLNTANIYADVPDKTETNSATITNASTGITVSFTNTYTQPPKVTVTPISSSTPVVAVLTGDPTTTSFTVKLFNLSGTAVTGSFIWAALGY